MVWTKGVTLKVYSDQGNTLINIEDLGIQIFIPEGENEPQVIFKDNTNKQYMLPVENDLDNIEDVIDTENMVKALEIYEIDEFFKDKEEMREFMSLAIANLRKIQKDKLIKESLYKDGELFDKSKYAKYIDKMFREVFNISTSEKNIITKEMLASMNMLNDSGKMKKAKDLIEFQIAKNKFDKKDRSKHLEKG